MRKLTTWFKKLTKPQQVTIFCTVLAAIISVFGLVLPSIITGISSIIVASINKSKPPSPTIISPNPEVERINAEISEYIKEIDNKPESDISEKQRLLNIVFKLLDESMKTDQNYGETYFLYAEAYLREKNYDNALLNYTRALENQYSYECDVHFGYGYIYEALGDRDLFQFDFSSADVHYKRSIEYLNHAIYDQKLSFYKHNINEAKEIVSRVEQKKEICKYDVIFRKAFHDGINVINDSNVHSDMEKLAKSYTDNKLWKYATLCYYWLFRQIDITGQRREKNTGSLGLMSEFWEFSDDFIYDISNNSVNAIIIDNNAPFRKEPILVDNNIIRKFSLYEELQVLERSNFRQSIGNVNAYWYKVYADDGIEGWVYGKYLYFYPVFQF